jgi:hypothetical protein
MAIPSTLAPVVKGVVVSTVQAECPACKHHVVIALPASVPEAESLYGDGGIRNGWLLIVAAVAVVACVATSFALGANIGDAELIPATQGVRLNRGLTGMRMFLAACWAFWVLVPPAWFAFEYFFLFKRSPGSFAALKYGQEQATKAWAAVVVVLGTFLLATAK